MVPGRTLLHYRLVENVEGRLKVLDFGLA